jgi:hypothetical protein
MRGRYLIGGEGSFALGNIYADKSALVLHWLLTKGVDKDTFSIREVCREVGISIGLVQRVFERLVFNGLLHSKGIRTAKKFYLKRPEALLKSWLEQYSITKRCKMQTFRSGLQKEEIFEKLQSDLGKKVALALHSSAEAYKVKNTNLNTVELYLLEPAVRPKLITLLELEPQEKGYEILLIAPYYKSLLKFNCQLIGGLSVAPILLTFLDLYHFPLRGQEQAEFMARRLPELEHIYKKGR